ncbi:branched-chain amino acid ABC transporter permease [Haloferax sp. S1W]|uniref:branched-chain amino acid ABC transporter permease n=1 Tax=Haloferax sp. S1W TaxID=3377110 RepID=UPI0037C63DF5
MIGELAVTATTPLFVDALLDFLDPGTLASVFVDGLSKAALYVMITAGLTLIFGLMGVLNFAHGSLTMIGAYAGGLVLVFLVSDSTGGVARLGAFFAAVAVVFALLAVAGAGIEMKLVRPLYDRNPLYQILLTFGLTLVLDELVEILVHFYGIQPTHEWQAAMATKPAFLTATYSAFGLSVVGLDLFEIAFGVLTVAAVWAFLTRTRYGLYIRAGSEDSEMTEALGINVRRAFTVVFGLGVGIAAVAGVLLAWDVTWGASVPLAAETLLPAFVVVIVGGLGTFRGTVAAAVIVGLVDATMTWWFQNVVDFPGLPEMTIFLILVVMLVVRPQGLFGVAEVGGH